MERKRVGRELNSGETEKERRSEKSVGLCAWAINI